MVKTSIGVDLTATSRRPSGISVIKYDESSKKITFSDAYLVKDDVEIISLIRELKPDCVSIDAPLSLPPPSSHYRKVDLKMKRLGFRVLPPRWRSMIGLTIRGIGLAEELRKSGLVVVETHPKSCLKSSGCRSIDELFRKIGLVIPRELTRDEIDATLASLACLFHLQGRSLVISDEDGTIVLLPTICVAP